MLDQFLASGSNFVVLVLAARSLTPTGFGAFAIAVDVYLGVLLVARGLASDPLCSAYAGDPPAARAAAIRAAAGATVGVGVALGVVVLLVGLLVGGAVGPGLLVLAALLPGLALQDCLRYALIVEGRSQHAFLNDLLWLVAVVPLLLVAGRVGGTTLLLVAWGAVGNAVAAVGLLQARTRPAGPRAVRSWVHRHRALWPYFLLDNLIFQATNLVLVVVVSATAGLAAVAGLRAALTVYAPPSLLGRGIVGVAVPELARWRDDPARVRRTALRLAWVLAPIALLWAGLAALVPDAVGRFFFGATWAQASPVVVLAGAVCFASLFSTGAGVGLRALSAGREGLAARVLVSVFGLAAASLGAVVDGVHGTFVVLAATAPVQVAVWWWLLEVAARRRTGPRSPSRTVSEPASEPVSESTSDPARSGIGAVLGSASRPSARRP